MAERYQVVIDRRYVTDCAVGRAHALALAFDAVDEGSACAEVLVLEADKLEARARWRRSGSGWRVEAQAGWLH